MSQQQVRIIHSAPAGRHGEREEAEATVLDGASVAFSAPQNQGDRDARTLRTGSIDFQYEVPISDGDLVILPDGSKAEITGVVQPEWRWSPGMAGTVVYFRQVRQWKTSE